jgi:5'-nucleotidase
VKPLILISNDDGIFAAGIAALVGPLEELGEVVVVAPDRERSATSHALTLASPLRAHEIKPGWWSVDGTPADCVYLATHHLCPRKPALVVSGINNGYNLGADFFYSGTVAAAVEGALRGIPSVAFSMDRGGGPDDLARAARFARALAHAILSEGLPPKTLLSVNVPRGELAGYRWTRLGDRIYRDQVDERTDPRGGKYFWIGGPAVSVDGSPDSDGLACQHGIVSVTPLDLDVTHHDLLGALPGWRLPGFEAILDAEATRRRDLA